MKCIEDEIPFELPEGWAWCRLGTSFFTVTGSTPSTKDPSLYGDEYPFYKPTDLDAGFDVNFSEDTVSEKGYKSGRILPEHSVLVTCIGATIGKTGYIRNSGICNQQINAILPNASILPEYTYFCMCSEFEQQQILTNSSATTLPILNKSKFDRLFFPVPPKVQQIRTVERIKDFFHFVEIIQQEKMTLQETIKLTKAQILDLAIRGKLVPQDPNDEPASVLLERIRAKKEELIKQGKIKRDKKESIIFRGDDNSYYETINENTICIDDELSFELPEGWEWTRLESVISLSSGKSIKVRQLTDEGEFPVYGGNGINGTYSDYNVEPETIVIGRVGYYCGSVYKTTSKAWVTDNALIVTVKEPNIFDVDFLVSILTHLNLGKTSVSTAQPVISGKGILPLIVPIPPYTEQQTITTISQNVLQMLDKISMIMS